MPTCNILEENIFYFTDTIQDPKGLLESIYKTEEYNIPESVSKWDEWTSSYESPETYVYGKRKIFSTLNNIDPDSQEYSTMSYIFDQILGATRHACSEYKRIKNIDGSIFHYPNFVIRKYNTETAMGPHHDTADGDPFLRFSLVTYLNDDYEGGEIEFPNQGIKIKPKAGSTIIFPSQSPYDHSSNVITKGNKYMTTSFWLNDPKTISSEQFADEVLTTENQFIEEYNV